MVSPPWWFTLALNYQCLNRAICCFLVEWSSSIRVYAHSNNSYSSKVGVHDNIIFTHGPSLVPILSAKPPYPRSIPSRSPSSLPLRRNFSFRPDPFSAKLHALVLSQSTPGTFTILFRPMLPNQLRPTSSLYFTEALSYFALLHVSHHST